MLAWSYILSARWAELIPGACAPEYDSPRKRPILMNGSATPENSQSPVVVDVGDVEDGATRWWPVVLSVDGGWHATIRNATGGLLHSPWSTTLRSERAIVLSAKPNMSSDTSEHSPASFNGALRYLPEYCNLHGVEEQSQAALAAALLLPTANSG